jgi:hypothetical protein
MLDVTCEGPGLGNFKSESHGYRSERLLKLSIDVATESGLRLIDCFEWDISNPDNVPEEFAACLVADMLSASTETPHLKDIMALENRVSQEIRR